MKIIIKIIVAAVIVVGSAIGPSATMVEGAGPHFSHGEGDGRIGKTLLAGGGSGRVVREVESAEVVEIPVSVGV